MRIEKHRLRDVMPHADGYGNPMVYWVFDQQTNELVNGPFKRARDAWKFADDETKERSAEAKCRA